MFTGTNTKPLAVIVASAIVVMLLSMFMLTGCGGEQSTADIEKQFEGKWEITAMSTPNDGDMTEMLDMLRDMGAELNVQFDIAEGDDNPVTINIASTSADESLHGTWKAVDANTAELQVEGDTQNAVIKDGKLILEQGETRMECEKASPNEQ